MFVLSEAGRILRENDPDRSDGPRFAMLGCTEGNLAFARQDMAEAHALVRLAERAPPWFDEALPTCAAEVARRLAPVASVDVSLVFGLPHHGPADDPRIVRSDTTAGERLLHDLQDGGVPGHLVEAGFLGVGDFWPPWCAVIEDGDIAALAFAARLGDAAAEVGVYTFPRWRGRGLAALATAAWSALEGLRDRQLFYTTAVTNRSSRQVAARLGLEHLGMGLRIT
jgi:hypothetical protein